MAEAEPFPWGCWPLTAPWSVHVRCPELGQRSARRLGTRRAPQQTVGAVRASPGGSQTPMSVVRWEPQGPPRPDPPFHHQVALPSFPWGWGWGWGIQGGGLCARTGASWVEALGLSRHGLGAPPKPGPACSGSVHGSRGSRAAFQGQRSTGGAERSPPCPASRKPAPSAGGSVGRVEGRL